MTGLDGEGNHEGGRDWNGERLHSLLMFRETLCRFYLCENGLHIDGFGGGFLPEMRQIGSLALAEYERRCGHLQEVQSTVGVDHHEIGAIRSLTKGLSQAAIAQIGHLIARDVEVGVLGTRRSDRKIQSGR